MQNYKIYVPEKNISVAVQEKAIKLGYKYKYSDTGFLIPEAKYIYLHEDKSITWGQRKATFDRNENIEISVEDFLAIKLPIETRIQKQIIQNNNMENKLKCVQAPQKAKNITVGNEYVGIYVDKDDTQVDAFEEAAYFMCTNNSNKEARYKIDLFQKPVPPKPDLEYLRSNIQVGQRNVTVNYNGRTITLVNVGLLNLSHDGVSCSCGIRSVNGLSAIYFALGRIGFVIDTEFAEGTNVSLARKIIFKAIIQAKIDFLKSGQINSAMAIFSDNDSIGDFADIMDEFATPTDWVRNPNSGNIIKAWLVVYGTPEDEAEQDLDDEDTEEWGDDDEDDN